MILRVTDTADTVKFEVIDHGPGMSKETQENLFSRFGKGDTPSDLKGSGLGLFISKWFIESQGGEVGFQSASKAGSTFWLVLPRNKN